MTDPPRRRARASIEINPPNLIPESRPIMMATTGLIFVWPPMRCPICRVMRAFLRNAAGRTLCVDCQEARMERESYD